MKKRFKIENQIANNILTISTILDQYKVDPFTKELIKDELEKLKRNIKFLKKKAFDAGYEYGEEEENIELAMYMCDRDWL